jgi:hypothetical protein
VTPDEIYQEKQEVANKALTAMEEVISTLEQEIAYTPVKILGTKMSPELISTVLFLVFSLVSSVVNKYMGL